MQNPLTSLGTSSKLDLDELGPSINETMYKEITGSLLYLTVDMLDILFSMGVCVRFEAYPNESHFKDAKRILRYVRGTLNLVLYPF